MTVTYKGFLIAANFGFCAHLITSLSISDAEEYSTRISFYIGGSIAVVLQALFRQAGCQARMTVGNGPTERSSIRQSSPAQSCAMWYTECVDQRIIARFASLILFS